MTKTLHGFYFLAFTLTFNACVQRNIYTTNEQPIIQTIPDSVPANTPVQIENPRPVINQEPIQIQTQVPTQTQPPVSMQTQTVEIAPSTAGNLHQLKTVQGPVITIQERSNGFIFPQYEGKIILLNVFGKNCPYCFKEMPIINSIKQKYAGKLQVVAFQAEEPMGHQEALSLIQEHQMGYPIIDKEEALNLLMFLQANYEWTGILPYMLLIKDGVTEFPFSGRTSYQELDEAISSLL